MIANFSCDAFRSHVIMTIPDGIIKLQLETSVEGHFGQRFFLTKLHFYYK